jgi:cellulose synthase/poly-beta-1,6-N-acetylglucosamine synthase-like glycosyltransferase
MVNESLIVTQDYGKEEETNHVISPSTLRIILSGICIFGIAFNLMVFCKRTRTTNRQTSTTKISLRLLCIMAIADSISLAALLLVLSIQYVGIRNPDIMTIICKVKLVTLFTE